MTNTVSSPRYLLIAVDGPAGSGKSTAARLLAEQLGCIHADSGAIYRTVTLALMERLGAGDSAEDFGRKLADANIDFNTLRCEVLLVNNTQSNRIAGLDVGDRIRTPEVTERIRYIADKRGYREMVNSLLRNFAQKTDLVVDGRDIGTVVFPQANFKFFLEASVRVRAERRRREYEARGIAPPAPGDLEEDIRKRDEQDMNRPFGALKRDPDAIVIDTSDLDINGVVHLLLSYLQIRF